MTLSRRPHVFKNRHLKVLHYSFACGFALAGWAWGGLVMSWAGHRPLAPTPGTGQIIPYNNHGIMFVTQRDLDTTHILLGISVASGLLAYFCYVADRRPWLGPNSN